MAEINTDIHKLVKFSNVMSPEDDVNEDENGEPACQTSLADPVDAIDVNTEEPASTLCNTSQPLLDPRFTQKAGVRKARLSVTVREDAMAFLADNYKDALQAWASLLQMTTFSCDIASWDTRFLLAFRVLDNAIADSQVSYMFARFAYFRLIQIFNALKAALQSERQKGQSRRVSGYRDASVALDIYLSAQGPPFTTQRRDLTERMRTGRRWRKLAGPSPFFLMIYSEAAKAVV